MVANGVLCQYGRKNFGSSANGTDKKYPGVLGTGVVKLPGLNCGRTGLTEEQAKESGFDVETVLAVTDDKAHYYPDAAFLPQSLLQIKEHISF